MVAVAATVMATEAITIPTRTTSMIQSASVQSIAPEP